MVSRDTHWWHKEEDRIVCDLCPRQCRLRDGQRGFCFVRANQGDQMVLTTYGKSTGFCIDPIEKKPLNHFLPGTPILSFGTAGCNLGCKFCQNWSISKSREVEILSAEASPEAIVAAAKEHGCSSIAFTYNDPIIWAEYAIDVAKLARQEGIKTVAVSAGYITPEARRDFFPHLDAANIDLKAFTDEFYRSLAFARIDPVLDTLKWLKHESQVWFEITNLVIPTKNDSSEEIGRLVDWVLENLGPDVPLHFTAFHPDFKMQDLPRTPAETLQRARQQAIDSGIHYAYVGNVLDLERQSTYCPSCGNLVIERNHYELGKFDVLDSKCGSCNAPIAGVFAGQRGDWGRKRLPISIPTHTKHPEMIQNHTTKERKDFSEEDGRMLLGLADRCIRAALDDQPPPNFKHPLEDAMVVGVFVSLKRGSQVLRSCCGSLNEKKPAALKQLLMSAAKRAAVGDERFPRIDKRELPHLDLEVSVMHDLRDMPTDPNQRLASITIGRHGLIISHPKGRGLLLPQVAAEREWDAPTFLEQVCRKANLPTNTWLQPEASLKQFSATIFDRKADARDIDFRELSQEIHDAAFDYANAVLADGTGPSDIPSELSMQVPRAGWGMLIQVDRKRAEAAFHDRGPLSNMISAITREIYRPDAENKITNFLVFSHHVPLDPRDFPDRLKLIQPGQAVTVRNGGRTTISLKQGNANPLLKALKQSGNSPETWAKSNLDVGLHLGVNWMKSSNVSSVESPKQQASPPDTRPTAVAGRFYPGTEAEVKQELDQYYRSYLSEDKQSVRAIMLPHAGWKYCGDIIAETLGQIEIPDLVVILGPKHTPLGPRWSVSNSRHWQIPGAKIPVDEESASYLAANIDPLVRDSLAHQKEHGIEVLLPHLHHLNPNIRIAPIVVGSGTLKEFQEIGDVLNSFRKRIESDGEKVLFIISSDLNHFAEDAENRRLDKLALDAFVSGDTERLFHTCTKENISMCGMRPAVAVLSSLDLHVDKGKPEIDVVRYETSARVSGDPSKVVGYAGALIT